MGDWSISGCIFFLRILMWLFNTFNFFSFWCLVWQNDQFMIQRKTFQLRHASIIWIVLLKSNYKNYVPNKTRPWFLRLFMFCSFSHRNIHILEIGLSLLLFSTHFWIDFTTDHLSIFFSACTSVTHSIFFFVYFSCNSMCPVPVYDGVLFIFFFQLFIYSMYEHTSMYKFIILINK